MKKNNPWLQKFLEGNPRALSRLISLAENQDPSLRKTLSELYKKTGRAKVIGITGSPGSGKSTLINCLILEIRRKNKKVGILAIDPVSPFTGGALLGDRIRLSDHFNDPEVYIRSLSTRGKLGGLSTATEQAVHLLDAFGMDFILVETVGVGQNEVDIKGLADLTAILLVPQSGDSIQLLKAGILEIGDLYIVNKADMEGSDKMASEITEMLERAKMTHAQVLKTSIREIASFQKLLSSMESFFETKLELITERRKLAAQNTAKNILETLFQTRLNEWVKKHMKKTNNPYTLVEEMLTRYPIQKWPGKP